MTQHPDLLSYKKNERLSRLYDRAHMLKLARIFFEEREIIEVDCPLISKNGSIDAHIDLMEVKTSLGPNRYLHSSPEYAMKRLLAEGIQDIYQMSHVFRDEECSPFHNPEFMMTEWYRHKLSFEKMIEETLDFIALFIGKKPICSISYREAFSKYAHIDYVTATEEELLKCLTFHHIEPYETLLQEGKDAILNVLLATVIEPCFKREELVVLFHYPATQAALAKTFLKKDEAVALRFEVFYKGLELANGYHELSDAQEQKKRFEIANEKRCKEGKKPLPIDDYFLKALKQGLPDCCGVAVGFDRLMMLRHEAKSIEEVISFGWKEA